MVRTFKTRTDGDIKIKTFAIRKSVVMKALVWLKDHDPECQHVTIAEENLNWTGDVEDEAAFSNVKEIITECDEEEAMKEHAEEDVGPSENQCMDHHEKNKDCEPVVNFVSQSLNCHPSLEEAVDMKELNAADNVG